VLADERQLLDRWRHTWGASAGPIALEAGQMRPRRALEQRLSATRSASGTPEALYGWVLTIAAARPSALPAPVTAVPSHGRRPAPAGE